MHHDQRVTGITFEGALDRFGNHDVREILSEATKARKAYALRRRQLCEMLGEIGRADKLMIAEHGRFGTRRQHREVVTKVIIRLVLSASFPCGSRTAGPLIR